MVEITRDAAAESLVEGGVTGEVATPRENNLSHIHRFLAQERNFDFGVPLTQDWDYDSVFDVMVARCGIRPERDYTEGVDTISTELCLDGLDRLRAAVSEVAGRGGRILFATGHPSGLLPVHEATAAWAEQLGADIVCLNQFIPLQSEGGDVRQIGAVWHWHIHGGLPHTHLAEPMHALLDALEEAGQPMPDLVVADHGWAGAAASRGLRTVGYADCNDPALFVAEAQGQVEVCVPLDDNIPPYNYLGLIRWLTR